MTVESATDRLGMLVDWGDTATIQGITGTVTGIFDDKYQVISADGETIDSAAPMFLCRTSDVPGVVNGQTCQIDGGTTYKIRSVQPDGTGMTRLILSKS